MTVKPQSWLIEYHPLCTHYKDGDHRERSGYYLCECKASSAWHKTTPDTRLDIVADAYGHFIEVSEQGTVHTPEARGAFDTVLDVLDALLKDVSDGET